MKIDAFERISQIIIRHSSRVQTMFCRWCRRFYENYRTFQYWIHWILPANEFPSWNLEYYYFSRKRTNVAFSETTTELRTDYCWPRWHLQLDQGVFRHTFLSNHETKFSTIRFVATQMHFRAIRRFGNFQRLHAYAPNNLDGCNPSLQSPHYIVEIRFNNFSCVVSSEPEWNKMFWIQTSKADAVRNGILIPLN